MPEDNQTRPVPPAPDAALAARVEELAARIAKTADAETKAFLETVLKAGETALADTKALKARLDEAEAKAAAAAAKMTDAAKRAALKDAAKALGAVDAADVAALAKIGDVKVNEDGESNASELVEALKKAKPHLFKAASTSSTASQPVPNQFTGKKASEMEIGSPEYNAGLIALGINPNRIRRG